MNDNGAPQRDQMLEIIERAEAKAEQCQLEAAIYRQELTRVKALADSASSVQSGLFLSQISRVIGSALESDTIGQWCKDWKGSWESDIGWLRDTLQSLKQIQTAATQLSASGHEQDIYLKQCILESLNRALIQRPSNVDLDALQLVRKEARRD